MAHRQAHHAQSQLRDISGTFYTDSDNPLASGILVTLCCKASPPQKTTGAGKGQTSQSHLSLHNVLT